MDASNLFGLPIKELGDNELQSLTEAGEGFKVIGKLYDIIIKNYTENRHKSKVPTNVLDISTQLEFAKQQEKDRLFYTIRNLAELAAQELEHRYTKVDRKDKVK